MEIEPLTDKWKAFGWHVIECDGNDIQSLLSSFAEAEKIKQKPVVIIAHTKMGKGVKAIEDDYRWHGKAPGEKEVNYFISLLLNT